MWDSGRHHQNLSVVAKHQSEFYVVHSVLKLVQTRNDDELQTHLL